MKNLTKPALSLAYAGRLMLLLMGALISAASATAPPPPDGPIVFFNCDINEGGDGQLYRINADGRGRRKLTTGFNGVELPRISPDGQRIAFGSDTDVDPPAIPGDGGIYIVSIDGGTPVVVPGTVGKTLADPAWTPDGQSLVFGCDLTPTPGDEGLCVIPVGGGTPNLITGTVAGDDVPDVSPDGNTVAFLRFSDNDNIYTIPISGGSATQVTNCPAPPGACDHPSFSPDGTKLAVQMGDDDAGAVCVALVDLTGSLPVLPTCHALSSPSEDEVPRFSPDGSEIIIDAGDGHLARLDVDGFYREQFFTGLPHSCAPHWGTPVSKNPPQAFCGKAYFDARRKAEGKIARLSLKFFRVSPECDTVAALPQMTTDLAQFDLAIDGILAQANAAIDKLGGAGQCDTAMQAILNAGPTTGMDRADLLQGATSGAEYLAAEVEQTCNGDDDGGT